VSTTARRLDEVPEKILGGAEDFFLGFRQAACCAKGDRRESFVQRAAEPPGRCAEGDRRESFVQRAAEPPGRCAEGDRREPFAQRFRALRSGGFRSTKLSTSTELEYKHKAPSLHVTPPDAKPVLAVRLSCRSTISLYVSKTPSIPFSTLS
jgi:hypothetical protein